jgi:hypothetical protein
MRSASSTMQRTALNFNFLTNEDPVGQRPPAVLLYKASQAGIADQIRAQLTAHNATAETIIEEQRLQCAMARSAARYGVFAMSWKGRRALFPGIAEAGGRLDAANLGWNDLRDTVSISFLPESSAYRSTRLSPSTI